ncbi:RNA polymerase sigma factor SigF [Speluncibacter jeojiensis]|uniref:RNA polymerase sigma factor SigF n=1 Tax=Speluncibacter jeojiensis TaxID=2710754 RepID=A0A9X4RCS3_9ACTN|nr:RNA polymerase sigma factor SigF [Corynebacteriales bacterium D3-21]
MNDAAHNAGHQGADRDLAELFDELANCPPEDERAAALRDRIIALALPLARNIARRFANRGEEFDDLYQVASLGLINAVDRFDPGRGREFAAFAVPTIMGEVRRHFRDRTWAVRVPRRLKDLSVNLNKTTETLTQRLGRSPTAAELATELGTDVGEIIEALAASSAYQTRSLDTPLAPREGGGVSLGDTIASDDVELDKSELRLALRPLLEQLPPRERRMLTLRFFHDKSQSEIAREIGISQVQVSRVLSKTLTRLRAGLAK